MNETQNAEAKTPKKRYDQNFKRSAVEHWLASGKSAQAVAVELGITGQTLLTWKQQLAMPVPAGQKPTMEQLLEENRRLRQENVSLIRQREILKKTLGILSTPSDNASSG
ncbi:MAG TPA: transposase [Verrucomicrobiae bacterium]|nr:transposase [Verrucomicrobiae bacterium]